MCAAVHGSTSETHGQPYWLSLRSLIVQACLADRKRSAKSDIIPHCCQRAEALIDLIECYASSAIGRITRYPDGERMGFGLPLSAAQAISGTGDNLGPFLIRPHAENHRAILLLLSEAS